MMTREAVMQAHELMQKLQADEAALSVYQGAAEIRITVVKPGRPTSPNDPHTPIVMTPADIDIPAALTRRIERMREQLRGLGVEA